jgi:hypothetical protein
MENTRCEVCLLSSPPAHNCTLSCGCYAKCHVSCLKNWFIQTRNGCITCRAATVYLHENIIKNGSPIDTVELLRIKIPSTETTPLFIPPASLTISYRVTEIEPTLVEMSQIESTPYQEIPISYRNIPHIDWIAIRLQLVRSVIIIATICLVSFIIYSTYRK